MNVSTLDASGLGLPDRDYYVKPDFKKELDGYQHHVGRMLALAGVAKPDVAAADAVSIEIELAKLTKTATERRDVRAANNPTDLKKLSAKTKSVDWNAYYKALGATASKKIVVGSPKYFAGLDGLRKKFKPAQWSGYFTYHVLYASALALPKAYDDEAFALRQLVSGAAEKLPRFRRCTESTTVALGELLGRAFVDKQFPAQSRQLAVTLVDAIAAA